LPREEGSEGEEGVRGRKREEGEGREEKGGRKREGVRGGGVGGRGEREGREGGEGEEEGKGGEGGWDGGQVSWQPCCLKTMCLKTCCSVVKEKVRSHTFGYLLSTLALPSERDCRVLLSSPSSVQGTLQL